jgi:uncharacterized protein YndB with AHSA1/START domain
MMNAHPVTRILGTLRAADGTGLVRLEDRYDTDINDLWSALTDPRRLVRWYGEIEGDLRVGGEFRDRVFASGWEGTSRIEICEPPQRLVVTTTEDGEPTEATEPSNTVQATLTADGDQTILVIEVTGVPIDKVEFYGAGWQIHVEDLAAYLAGQERSDATSRFDELVPPYQALAAHIR